MGELLEEIGPGHGADEMELELFLSQEEETDVWGRRWASSEGVFNAILPFQPSKRLMGLGLNSLSLQTQ